MTDDDHAARLRMQVLEAVFLRKDDPEVERRVDVLIRYHEAKARVDTVRVCAAQGDDIGWCHLKADGGCANCRENVRAEADLAAIIKEINDA